MEVCVIVSTAEALSGAVAEVRFLRFKSPTERLGVATLWGEITLRVVPRLNIFEVTARNIIF